MPPPPSRSPRAFFRRAGILAEFDSPSPKPRLLPDALLIQRQPLGPPAEPPAGFVRAAESATVRPYPNEEIS